MLFRAGMLIVVLAANAGIVVGEGVVCRRCGCTQPPKVSTRVECRDVQAVSWRHNLEAAPACLPGPSRPYGTTTQCDPVTHTTSLVPKWFPTLGKPVTVVQLVRSPKWVTQKQYVSITECTCPKCGIVGTNCTPLPNGERWRLYPDPATERRELMAAQIAAMPPAGVVPSQNLPVPAAAPPTSTLPPGAVPSNDSSSPPQFYRSTP